MKLTPQPGYTYTMSRLKQLIHEVHRRSLWQVLGIYVIGGWLVLQAVDTLAGALNLPEWAPPLALFMLIIGLPLALATAFVQEGVGRREAGEVETTSGGTPIPSGATDEGTHHRIFTWRNAMAVGVIAFAIWGVVAMGWLLFGPGTPVGSADARDLRSIAVLPFETRSTEDAEEAAIFADGMHDDLLTQLSKVGALRVIARTSMHRYEGTEKTIPEIAKELGVATVLEGRVDRVGDRVRVNVQLIDAETNDHLWADTYDEQLTAANLFDIRTDLVKKTATALQATLTPEVAARIEARPTEDLEAYNLFVRGRHFWNQRTREGLETAMDHFRRVLERDSMYALAWAGLADTYALLAVYRYMPWDEGLAMAETAAEKALALDETLAEAHAALGLILEYQGDLAAAGRELRHALELNSNYPSAHHWYANWLRRIGRADEALAAIQRAHELDPLSPIISETLGEQLFFTFQFDEALDQYDRTIELDPEFALAHNGKNLLLISLGRFDEALSEALRARELNPYQYALSPALVSYYDREYEMALREAEENGAYTPESYLHELLSSVYLEQGRYLEATEEYERWEDSAPGQSPFRVLTLAYIQARSGRRAEALEILGQVEQLRDDPGWNNNVARVAAVFGAVGEHDRAFDLLEEAFEVKSQSILRLKVDPLFDPLRADPRFAELMSRMGLG